MSKTPAWLVMGEGHADITLSRPAKIDGADTTALRMREPNVQDQISSTEGMGSDSVKEIGMFANLCEVSPDDLRQLPLRDYKRLQTAFLGFID